MAPREGGSSRVASRLGDPENVASVGGAKPTSEQMWIHENVPNKAAPNQIHPPCNKPMAEIQGGC